MKTKKTYEEIFEFIAVAQQWLIKDKINMDTKLAYAINKMMTSLKSVQKRYNARLADIQIDSCLVNEKGKILKDDKGNFEYSKSGIKERNSKIQELDDTKVEFEPHMAPDLPRKPDGELNLTYAECMAFDGFVLINNLRIDESQDITQIDKSQSSAS